MTRMQATPPLKLRNPNTVKAFLLSIDSSCFLLTVHVLNANSFQLELTALREEVL